MAALFSCTKCHKRYPFDQLSQGEQLCKDCRSHFPVVKCTYCRAEFQQKSKGSTSSICAKCAQNVKHFGKPTACENCSVLAAFIGNRCQRCVNSEKKWGPPLICEQCKLKCAFDRPERRKLDGKLMCWLCDLAYKRVLAKTRKTQDLVLKPNRSTSSLIDSSSKSNIPASNEQVFPGGYQLASSEGMTVLERLTKLATSGGSSRGNTPTIDAERLSKIEGENRLSEKPHGVLDRTASEDDNEVKDEKRNRRHHKHHHRKHSHHHSHWKRHVKDDDDDTASDIKKSKSEKSSANGVTAATSTPKSTDSNVSDAGVDTAASENVILITQLREQIESLKKQMAAKDQQLLEKDKKITELRAQMYESDKVCRAKVQALQQSHTTAVENFQIKNRELARQVSSLSKSKKCTETSTLNLLTS